jgi:riboflavin synthase
VGHQNYQDLDCTSQGVLLLRLREAANIYRVHSHQEENAEHRKELNRGKKRRAKEKKTREAQVCDYSRCVFAIWPETLDPKPAVLRAYV